MNGTVGKVDVADEGEGEAGYELIRVSDGDSVLVAFIYIVYVIINFVYLYFTHFILS